MSKSQETREALLRQARQQFWAKGYSNVGLREIARGAGVDVALIARYFGSKRGLFEATLEALQGVDADRISGPEALVDHVVWLFLQAPRGGAAMPSPTALILHNADDPDVGEMVRRVFSERWQQPMEQILGGPKRAALFSAAMLGMSVAEKTLCLGGITVQDRPLYEAQLRALLQAALRFDELPG
ncbi:MAG: TetR/AcrR family transcriptional regulator [Mangrovicoccus sp.]|nr:TetR/AcrR family transcriptional regulator [Mangrovicoccus sp.]